MINLFILNGLSSILIIVFLIFISNKFEIIMEGRSHLARKIHNTDVIRVGSLSLLPILFFIEFYLQNNFLIIIIYCFMMLLVGLLEDLSNKLSYSLRLASLFLITTLFVITQNFIVEAFDNKFLSFISNIYLISIIFSILGFIFLINGINFLDGLNGLALGVSSLIILNFYFLSRGHPQNIDNLCLILLIPIFSLFLFNLFTGKIYLGDGGAYFLGGIIGCLSILIANNQIELSTKIACIIAFPIYEIIFTFFRRIIKGKNPFRPDDKHLHTLLYKLISSKLINEIKDFNTINSISSLIIIIFFSIYLILFNFLISSYFIFFFGVFFIIYLFIYFYLNEQLKKG